MKIPQLPIFSFHSLSSTKVLPEMFASWLQWSLWAHGSTGAAGFASSLAARRPPWESPAPGLPGLLRGGRGCCGDKMRPNQAAAERHPGQKHWAWSLKCADWTNESWSLGFEIFGCKGKGKAMKRMWEIDVNKNSAHSFWNLHTHTVNDHATCPFQFSQPPTWETHIVVTPAVPWANH